MGTGEVWMVERQRPASASLSDLLGALGEMRVGPRNRRLRRRPTDDVHRFLWEKIPLLLILLYMQLGRG